MSELRQILALWNRAKALREEVCLATVVQIEGSSYRKPGARMLLTSGGQRAGTVSGGCLEAEISKKAWWLTESGPTVQKYSSFFDEDTGIPYGLGCGGTAWVLLERGPAVADVLEALRRSIEERTASVVVTAIGQALAGTRFVTSESAEMPAEIKGYVLQVLQERASLRTDEYFVEYLAPPPALHIFGAGDDAQPLVSFACALGWHISVTDGRSHLARSERFPSADTVAVHRAGMGPLQVASNDAAVIMTHSYQQDGAFLKELLPRDLAYLGILGPRLRTARLLKEVASQIGLSLEEAMQRLHAPVGLNIGATNPAGIALSIAAEIQAAFAGRSPSLAKIPDEARAC